MAFSSFSLDFSKLPQHVAIIMDGNGRWAKKHGFPRFYGHQKGAETAKKVIEKTYELKIPYLTLFAFSKENWKRPKEEVEAILELFKMYLTKEKQFLIEKGIRLKIIGDREDFSQDLVELIEEIEEETKNNSELTLCLALSYGGRSEILKAVKEISNKVKQGLLDPENIDEKVFREHLYTKDIPDPDLLIRTSGEERLSNFLLFQIAYTELYFTPVYWPEFTEEEYLKALWSYQQRERRFGGVCEF
ncbi:isoprenyl transferase [Thermodesulfobacterium commune]|jgi:undecaprenyl diphosphate synthase|uniref:Isoprenyl transferase n=1 Tax=Thermodesulfobacterium commune DSM 2178 TaxID=289377 RepID=A0A075WYC7_9BACT|nr:isoprenyl transferase [Thermodesulfobacterium commune]AIH03582.1 UDP pyrophosphate synthase [Thermodesulfobacterium commune DSM 2178]